MLISIPILLIIIAITIVCTYCVTVSKLKKKITQGDLFLIADIVYKAHVHSRNNKN